MVRLEKHGDSAVRFIFTDSDHYLYKDGVVDVPVNSLSLVIDESEMVTFKKASTADPFISFRLDKSNFSSRDELLTFYKENMVGAGLSEEEVQEMIDAATSGIPSSEVVEQLRTDVNTLSGNTYSKSQIDGFLNTAEQVIATKADSSALTEVRQDVNTLSGKVDTKVDATTYESGQYATAQALNALQENKLDASAYTPTDLSQYWTSGQTQEAINAATSGIPSSQVIEQLQTDVNNLQGETQGIWDTIDEKEEVIASALTQLNQDVSDIDEKEEVIASALTEVNLALDNKLDASALTSIESDITAVSNDLNTLSGAVIDNEYTVSQAINSLNNRVTEDEEVTAAALNDLQENKADTSAVTAAIDAAISGKADTSAVTAAIDDAKAYYISFATLATVGIHDEDWNGIVAAIDDHRPIYAGYPRTDGGIIYYGVECMNKNSDNTQIVLTSSDDNSHYFYTFTKNGSNDYTFTSETRPYVTDAEMATWNAKQDALSAGTGISISNNVISTSGVVFSQTVTQLVKLTQTAYDNLVTKDANTLYIISD